MTLPTRAAEPFIPADPEAARRDAMRQPSLRGLLARTAAFVVLVAASATLMALPHLADGHAAEEPAGVSTRVSQAFEVAEETTVRQELIDAMAAAAGKTDRLSVAAPCGAQAGPQIAGACLADAGDRNSGERVRTVTIEYQLGANSSALVRMPMQPALLSARRPSGLATKRGALSCPWPPLIPTAAPAASRERVNESLPVVSRRKKPRAPVGCRKRGAQRGRSTRDRRIVRRVSRGEVNRRLPIVSARPAVAAAPPG
jgi:hypothetical protein